MDLGTFLAGGFRVTDSDNLPARLNLALDDFSKPGCRDMLKKRLEKICHEAQGDYLLVRLGILSAKTTNLMDLEGLAYRNAKQHVENLRTMSTDGLGKASADQQIRDALRGCTLLSLYMAASRGHVQELQDVWA